MTLAYIGLGKMGKNMVLRLLEQGQEVVVWNRSQPAVDEVVEKGAKSAGSISELVSVTRSISTPVPHLSGFASPQLDVLSLEEREKGKNILIWLMLPAGEATESILMNEVLPLLKAGDIVIDGANSNFNDTVRRNKILEEKGIHFIDAGVSGGPNGARNGACVMIGGEEDVVNSLDELWKAISAPEAYGYFGKSGAGHFVKMVHNGIEYGMMQAIGEGFELMKKSDLDLNLTEITRVYNEGSVIESRLIGWLKSAFEKHGEELSSISGSVAHSGEGLWTVETAESMNIPVPIIKGSLDFRIQSQDNPSYTGKVVSALRGEFGGHSVREVKHG